MSVSLAAQQLEVWFSTPQGDLPALGPISVHIPAGQFVCLIGPSGCGKTTLIRVFAGLQQPTSGVAKLGGEQINGPSPRAGMMFQQTNLMPWRTVEQNIWLPLELAGVPGDERRQRTNSLMQMLRLDEFAQTYPGALSGGMAQRAALGRLLAQGPDVLLLDEPFGALDAITREQVSMDLQNLWQQANLTVLMVTHDINEAILLSDRILVMSPRPGQVMQDIAVDLPRPRHVNHIYDPQFSVISQQVRAAIDYSA